MLYWFITTSAVGQCSFIAQFYSSKSSCFFSQPDNLCALGIVVLLISSMDPIMGVLGPLLLLGVILLAHVYFRGWFPLL